MGGTKIIKEYILEVSLGFLNSDWTPLFSISEICKSILHQIDLEFYKLFLFIEEVNCETKDWHVI